MTPNSVPQPAPLGAPHPPVLSVDNLAFAYPGRWLFAGWHQAFGPGLTWVRGANGCGKSTLLKLLGGALAPVSGRLVCLGTDASTAPEAYRRQVHWCSPDPIVLGHLKPAEYFGFLAGLYPTMDLAAVPAQVQALGLSPFMDKRIDQLSTGTGRKVAVVAALTVGTPVVLLDEPLAGLDRASIRHVQAELARAAHAAAPVKAPGGLAAETSSGISLDAHAGPGPTSPRAWIVTSHDALGAEAEALAATLDLDDASRA